MPPSTPANAVVNEDLQAMMDEHQLAPLWAIYERMVRPEPVGAEPGHLWRWTDLEPVLELAGRSVGGRYAEHRVLLLAHPAFTERISTTRNLLAGVQCVMPGEKTVPHHHVAADVRFVLEGEGGETTVDGKACPLNAGDLVLTPNWTWHGHSNASDRPVVWVDMLDLPLVGGLGAFFQETGPPERLPRSAVTLPDESYRRGGLTPMGDYTPVDHSPRVHWPMREVVDALQHAPRDADGSRRVRYTDPVRGGAVTPTLDVYALELPPGQSTRPLRRTGTALCIVIEGNGRSTIGDVELAWSRNDIFTVPNWTWHAHVADDRTARLLVVTDREIYRRTGWLREQHSD